MQSPFPHILYGGDYNPNQWPRDVWDEDIRLFKQAGINSATINVFSWAKLQPDEETYDFSELDEIVEDAQPGGLRHRPRHLHRCPPRLDGKALPRGHPGGL